MKERVMMKMKKILSEILSEFMAWFAAIMLAISVLAMTVIFKLHCYEDVYFSRWIILASVYMSFGMLMLFVANLSMSEEEE